MAAANDNDVGVIVRTWGAYYGEAPPLGVPVPMVDDDVSDRDCMEDLRLSGFGDLYGRVNGVHIRVPSEWTNWVEGDRPFLDGHLTVRYYSESLRQTGGDEFRPGGGVYVFGDSGRPGPPAAAQALRLGVSNWAYCVTRATTGIPRTVGENPMLLAFEHWACNSIGYLQREYDDYLTGRLCLSLARALPWDLTPPPAEMWSTAAWRDVSPPLARGMQPFVTGLSGRAPALAFPTPHENTEALFEPWGCPVTGLRRRPPLLGDVLPGTVVRRAELTRVDHLRANTQNNT
jgi:hypothetical protein